MTETAAHTSARGRRERARNAVDGIERVGPPLLDQGLKF